MASGFIGSIEEIVSSGSGYSPTLSYTAPSTINFAVVTIAESASAAVTADYRGAGDAVIYVNGFAVAATGAGGIEDATGLGASASATSANSRIVLGPNESVSVRANYDVSISTSEVSAYIAYTAAMSVLEVNN